MQTQKPAGTEEVETLYHVNADVKTTNQGEFKHTYARYSAQYREELLVRARDVFIQIAVKAPVRIDRASDINQYACIREHAL